MFSDLSGRSGPECLGNPLKHKSRWLLLELILVLAVGSMPSAISPEWQEKASGFFSSSGNLWVTFEFSFLFYPCFHFPYCIC